MAKPTRGGLGRGLTSLIGGSDTKKVSETKKPDRETIRYDEKNDIVYEENNLNTNETASSTESASGSMTNTENNVSRETLKINETDKSSLVTKDASGTAENSGTSILYTPTVPPSINKDRQNDNPADSEENLIKKIANIQSATSSSDTDTDNRGDSLMIEVDIDLVQPNPEQPRTNFDEEELEELSNSIKRNGLIQPILVRNMNDGTYQIIAGERRWQAAKKAGLDRIQVHIKDLDDNKALEFALIENIQRSDLNPIEEAYGYKRMMERNKMTQADIAQAVSKGRSTIANTLRLLELPEEAQQLLFEEKITAGHARAILSVQDKEDRLKLTYKLLDKKLTVRETESLAASMNNGGKKKAEREPQPAVYKSVARALKSALDTTVKIKSSKGKNRIEIEFKDEKDLERLFDLINPE